MDGFSLAILFVIRTWYFEPIPNAGGRIALDVDTCGKPAIGYWRNDTIYYAPRVSMGDSFAWPAEIVDTTPFGPFVYHTNFAVGKNYKPHIVYHKWRHYPDYLDVYYATKDSLGIWSSVMLDSFAVGPDIDTDSLDYPHIVYFGNSLLHAYWNGSSWVKENMDDDYGLISIKIDRNDTLHVGLGAPITINDTRQGWVGYGHKDSIGWHFEYMHQYDVRDPVGIDIDTSNKPHLSFEVFSNSCYHLVKINDSWLSEDLTGYGFFGSLIAINNTMVHLLGTDGSGSVVRHIWKSDSVWFTEDIHTGSPRDFAIDKEGYLHCLLVDNAMVIYGTNRPQVGVSAKVEKVLSTLFTDVICRFPMKISFRHNDVITEINIINIYGRLVKKIVHFPDDRYVLWNGLDIHNREIGDGVYFIVLKGSHNIWIQKFIVVR